MKKIFKSLVFTTFILSSGFALAQAPQQFSYQSVIRDNSGVLLTNQSVGIQISILQGGTNGSPVYIERHFPTSNTNGLVTLSVGNGTIMAGDFQTIDWAAGPYYSKIEVDPTGGTGYTLSSTCQFLSVPYALYAATSGNGTGPAGADGVGITSTINNGNGTYTFNYSDGSSFTTTDLTGPQGATGAQGLQGATGATGPQGPAGADGVGITSTVNNGNGTYTFNYSDGSSFTTADLTGPQGATGLKSLIKTTTEAAGANCEYGGVKIQGGVDTNNDGILQTSEVTMTEYVCDGNPNGFDHYIGEVYGGGIIYYLWRDAGGVEHGLIASPGSLVNYPWATTSTYISNCNSTFDGLSNTNIMIAAGNTTSEAAGAADAYAAGGYIDWYLPSVDEMALMIDQRFIINKVIVGGALSGAGTIASSYFWTSTQLSTTNAKVYDSASHSATNFTKSTTCLVRPIRAF